MVEFATWLIHFVQRMIEVCYAYPGIIPIALLVGLFFARVPELIVQHTWRKHDGRDR